MTLCGGHPVAVLDRLSIEEASMCPESVEILAHLSDMNLPRSEKREVSILIGCAVPRAHFPYACKLRPGKQRVVVKSLP